MSRLFLAMLVLLSAASRATAQDLVLFIHTVGSEQDGLAFPTGNDYTFPDTAAGASNSVTFRLKNVSASNAYLVLSINFSPGSAFAAQGAYSLKCLAPGGTNEDFTVMFSPPDIAAYQDNLQISYVPYSGSQGCTGSIPNVTPVTFGTFYGTGIKGSGSGGGGTGTTGGGGGTGSLTFAYTNGAGLSEPLSSGATAVFGDIAMGATESLQFTLTNPSTATGPVSVPQVAVSSGSAFSIPTSPAAGSIQPGGSVSFPVVFAPTPSTLPFSGVLSLGSQTVNLIASFPAPTLGVTTGTVENQQQDTVQVNLPYPAPYATAGNLTLSFTPAITGVSTDPAVFFTSTSGSTITVQFAQGAENGTFNNQPIGFQTGTTAGTLTFTLCTVAGATCTATNAVATQSYTIAPQLVQIATATAVSNDPNLVITLSGYDNTYSTGKLVFTFYDSNGNSLTPGGLAFDATSEFSQYFFAGQGYGGAFAMQATFPVSGTITQTINGTTSTTWAGADVYSVAVTLQNSAGTSLPQTILFQ